MVEFYVNMIKLGRMTTEQVSELWREEVQAALDSSNPDFHIDSEIEQKAAAWDELTGGGANE